MKKQLPLVSVLMTAYNRERYIGTAIESVLASTYPNFELIITDDGSKDNTLSIVNSFAAKDARVKVFVNERNLGDYGNRNMAASVASGKYLKYVDADDYIYPWGLQLLVEMMEENPEAGWGLCSLEPDIGKPFPFVLHGKEIFNYEYFGPGVFHKAPLSSIITSQVFGKVGGFSGKQHLGDFELWHKLSLHSPLLLMPHGIVWYRTHDEQESKSNRQDPEVNLKYFISALNFFEELRTNVLDEALVVAISHKLKHKIIKTILGRLKRGEIRIAYRLYRASKKREYTFE